MMLQNVQQNIGPLIAISIALKPEMSGLTHLPMDKMVAILADDKPLSEPMLTQFNDA